MSERKRLEVLDTDHFECDGCGVYVPVEDCEPGMGTCIKTPHHWVINAGAVYLCSDCMGDLVEHWGKMRAAKKCQTQEGEG